MFPVEVFQSTIAKLTSILRLHDIRFHLTGGLTGTAYGEPRMTQDIDVVIDPKTVKTRVEKLLDSLARSDFIFDAEDVRLAVATEDLFQLLDQTECLKLDIYPREMIPGELDRSESLEIFEGELLPVASRVDAALSKLIWIDKGSHKSRRDLRAIVRSSSDEQQRAIRSQATHLGLSELFDIVIAEPDELR